MTRTLEFDIAPLDWLSSNQRLHRHEVAARTGRLRRAAGWRARTSATPMAGPVVITAEIQYPTSGRADPPNAWPAVKALVDGLVDAGVLADDDAAHVPVFAFRRAPGKTGTKRHKIRLCLEPWAGSAHAQNDLNKEPFGRAA